MALEFTSDINSSYREEARNCLIHLSRMCDSMSNCHLVCPHVGADSSTSCLHIGDIHLHSGRRGSALCG